MQDASPELDAAIDAYEQAPTAELAVSWDGSGTYTGTYDDLSDSFSRVRITRTLEGGLPEQARIVSGSSVAELSAELARGQSYQEQQNAAWWYSRLNADSPLSGLERLARPIVFNAGYVTSAGPETLQQFVGTTTALDVNARAGSAQLVAHDYRRKIAQPVLLPLHVYFPANAQWWIDWVLRQNGVYASPPVISDAIVSATLHGAIYPEISASTFSPYSSTTKDVVFEQGKFGLALNDASTIGIAMKEPRANTNTGGKLYSQCWVKCSQADTGMLYNFTADLSGPGAVGAYVEFTLSAGRPRVAWKRRSSDALSSVLGPLLPADGTQWRYLAFHIAFTSHTLVTININIDGSITSYTAASASVPFQESLYTMRIQCPFPIQDIQASNAAWPVASDHAFSPQAVLSPSLNTVQVTPDPGTEDSWQITTDIANAENAAVFFDETGILRYLTQADLTASGSAVDTIDINHHISDIGYTDGLQQIYNSLTIPTKPLRSDGFQRVWKSGFVYAIGGEDTLVIDIKLADPTIVHTLGFFDGTTDPDPDTSTDNLIWANANAFGTGTNKFSSLDISIVQTSAQTARITIINNSLTGVFLADPSGNPGIWVMGTPYIADDSRVLYQVEDTTSQASFGVRHIALADNPWRQNPDSAADIGAVLLPDLAYPRPTLTRVRVDFDPRRQLTDRYDVIGPVGISAQYWIQGIETVYEPKPYQVLTLREAL